MSKSIGVDQAKRDKRRKLVELATSAERLVRNLQEETLSLDDFWCEMEVLTDHARYLQIRPLLEEECGGI